MNHTFISRVALTGYCCLWARSSRGRPRIPGRLRWTPAGGSIVMRVVMVQDDDEDPAAAGKGGRRSAAEGHAWRSSEGVIVSECFEDRSTKRNCCRASAASSTGTLSLVEPPTVPSRKRGCTDFDSVCLLGIGGDGIGVSAALVTELGTAKLSFDEHEAEIKRRLHAAGNALSEKLRRPDHDQTADSDPRCPFAEESVPGGRCAAGVGGRASP